MKKFNKLAIYIVMTVLFYNLNLVSNAQDKFSAIPKLVNKNNTLNPVIIFDIREKITMNEEKSKT